MKKLNAYDYYLIASLLYWIFIMYRLSSREYLEMGDTFSFFIYSFFVIIHSIVLIFRFLLRNRKIGLRLVIGVSILPSVATGIFMMISIFFGIISLSK